MSDNTTPEIIANYEEGRQRERAEAAEARCADLQARCERLEGQLSVLTYAAKGGNALKRNADAFRFAADELARIGSTETDFIRALKERASMLDAALQHTTAETGDG